MKASKARRVENKLLMFGFYDHGFAYLFYLEYFVMGGDSSKHFGV